MSAIKFKSPTLIHNSKNRWNRSGIIEFLIYHVTSRSHVIKDQRASQLYGCDPLTVSHNPINIGGHRLCKSGDLMFLIGLMTSHDQVTKG